MIQPKIGLLSLRKKRKEYKVTTILTKISFAHSLDRDEYLENNFTAYTNSKREVKIHINGRDLILVPYVRT